MSSAMKRWVSSFGPCPNPHAHIQKIERSADASQAHGHRLQAHTQRLPATGQDKGRAVNHPNE